jgi:hypothetical protein
MPYITALSWRLSLVRLPRLRKPARGAGRVLVLNKIGGTDDLVVAYQDVQPDFDFLFLRRGLVRVVFKYFLGDLVRNYNYVSADPDIGRRKLAYRRFLKDVLRHLHRLIPFKAALSFNVSYEAEREFAAAMTELGIPHIVFHKESVKTEIQSRVYSSVYRRLVGPFMGSHVAVYNVEERDTMLASGIVKPEQIAVIGCPRVDLAHRLRSQQRSSNGAPTVVYFTIDERASLPYADKEWVPFGQDWYTGPPLVWRDLARQTGDCLLEFARENPHVQVIFKAKQGNENFSRTLLPGELPSNVSFVAGGIGHALLTKADVVVGFNSATLLEAIAAGKPIAVPMFGVDALPNAERLVYRLDEVARYAKTTAEMKAALLQLLGNGSPPPTLTASARRALERYVGNSDGAAGARMREYLRRTISDNIPARI